MASAGAAVAGAAPAGDGAPAVRRGRIMLRVKRKLTEDPVDALLVHAKRQATSKAVSEYGTRPAEDTAPLASAAAAEGTRGAPADDLASADRGHSSRIVFRRVATVSARSDFSSPSVRDDLLAKLAQTGESRPMRRAVRGGRRQPRQTAIEAGEELVGESVKARGRQFRQEVRRQARFELLSSARQVLDLGDAEEGGQSGGVGAEGDSAMSAEPRKRVPVVIPIPGQKPKPPAKPPVAARRDLGGQYSMVDVVPAGQQLSDLAAGKLRISAETEEPQAKADADEDGYTYDLYYADDLGPDLDRLLGHASLNIMSYDELVADGDDDDDELGLYDDEEDSNDEGHYANDYPDEEEGTDEYDSEPGIGFAGRDDDDVLDADSDDSDGEGGGGRRLFGSSRSGMDYFAYSGHRGALDLRESEAWNSDLEDGGASDDDDDDDGDDEDMTGYY